ncbi:hypothetical protein D9619_002950 [Psilocybe cf. subviscida]|uniref:Major facilitator superfamily (MFS) profile domain-containing protein n=1 Tax=Psilocybe cf. subviscida TaxID=2480587 RepID=A0A8H5AXN2_9AGAR|nr:hypothetical protein D9619_002950 [Psilocybe cf. subviscida]
MSNDSSHTSDTTAMNNHDEKADSNEHASTQVQTYTQPTSPENIDSEASRFSKREKWFIVCFTAFVGLFSPLTANIYFPALPALSRAFNKSTELINLTVTMYMILQGVAPMLWGPVSDHFGRRPISAICLLILSLSCVGLALVPTSAFWLLMFLRCIQASGSASTIAVGAGVVGDISTRAERGGFFGIFTIGPMAPIGPVLGGVLSDKLGWRAIFWFLCIAASVCFVIIILFQPETLQLIADRGQHNVPILYKPVLPVIGRNSPAVPSTATRPKVSRNPFRLFLNPDVDVLLLIAAISCAIFYGVIATISTSFAEAYPFLTQTTIGLCFLSIGGGMMFGSSVSGRVFDRQYAKYKAKAQARMSADPTADMTREESFPLEKARLRLIPYLIILQVVACAGYGWSIQKRVNIAVPLILHFIIGSSGIAIMNGASTLMIDLVPGQSSSVTACNNFVRCTLSAVLVSVIDLIIKAIGNGWTYVILAVFELLSIPLIFLAIRIGPKYRVRRQRQREEALLKASQ